MIEYLESIDRSIVLAVNGMHTPMLDEFMWLVSGKLTWVPMYLIVIFMFARKTDWKRTVVFVLSAIIVVALADQLSVHLFKNVFLRYRPSHHSLLTNRLHFYDLGNGDYYKGGQFGFVSSHAANFFGLCTFLVFGLKSYYRRIGWALYTVAAIVCLSRLYLGVHYLSDLIGGALLGVALAWTVYRLVFIRIIDSSLIRK